MFVMFSMLISRLERTCVPLYEVNMKENQLRRRRSWEDYMGEWCNRADIRVALPALLRGGYPKVTGYIKKLAASNQVA